MDNPLLFTSFMIVSDILLIIGLYIFLSGYKAKKVKGILVEHVVYPFTYVIRAFCKPKRLWIVYDYKMRKFRSVSLRHPPIKPILAMILGAFLVFTSYLIALTLTQSMSLLIFRLIILVLFFVIGLYGLLVGLYRMFSYTSKNADKIAKFLNKDRYVRSLIEKGDLYVQISPNFLLKEGFVDSVEFVLSDKADAKRLEKVVMETARMINKV